jgi:Uma2 family endonuclease
MAEPARKKMTLSEFLQWDDGTDSRYELIDGQAFAMAPPIRQHGGFTIKIGAALDKRVRPPCWVATQLGVLLPYRKDAFYEPDVVATCEPRNRERYIEAPRIVVEVLSPSTEDHDLLQKLPDYRRLPSVDDVLYISAEERLVRHWVRGQASQLPARVREGSVKLQAFDIELPLDEIYEGSGL